MLCIIHEWSIKAQSNDHMHFKKCIIFIFLQSLAKSRKKIDSGILASMQSVFIIPPLPTLARNIS